MRLSVPAIKIRMKIDSYYQQQKRRQISLVSGSIRFMRMFAEVPWGRGVKRLWGCRERQFSAFSLAISSDTLEMRPELLYRYAVRRRLFSDPKTHDLESPRMVTSR